MRRLVFARFISSAGFEASFFVGLWGKVAFELDGDVTDLAIMSAVVGIATVVGTMVGGVAVDRHGPRPVMVVGELLFVPATLSLAAFESIPPLLAVSAVVWALGGAIETAMVSIPPALVDDDALERANAHLEGANWLALVLGPAFGAALVTVASINWIFLFDALTSIVAVGALVGLEVPRPVRRSAGVVSPTAPPLDGAAPVAPADDVVGGWSELKEGLAISLRTPQIRFAMVLGGLVYVAFGVFVALEPLFYRDVVETDISVLGWVNAVFGVGLFAGSVALSRSGGRFGGFRPAVAINAGAGVGAMLYVASGDLRVVVVGAVAWSIPLGMALPLTRTLAQRATPPEAMGRVMGTMGTLQSGASVLPVVFAPAVAAAVGVQATLVASGALVVAAAPWLWAWAGRLQPAGGLSGDPAALPSMPGTGGG